MKVVGLDGSQEMIIRREVQPEPATDRQLDRYAEGVLCLVSPEGSDPSSEDVGRYRRSLLSTPRASTLPILRSVKLDTEGNVWVEMYFHPERTRPLIKSSDPMVRGLGK